MVQPPCSFRLPAPTARLATLLMCVVAWTAAAQTDITADNLRDEHVQLAINALVEEIHARRTVDRFWEPNPYPGDTTRTQAGGYTALAVLALFYAGETYQSERLKDAIEYLTRTDFGGTYAIGIRAHVWAMLPPKFDALLDKDRTWLLSAFSDRAAGWNYEHEPTTGRRDNSITQYGALGLWEAAKRGQRVEPRYWQLMEDRFIAMQLADGGWNYTGDGPSTGSMTTAGLTVLFITQDFLHAQDAARVGAAKESPNQAAINRGLRWMDANFSATNNPGRDLDYYYYLYGVERVGLASGYKFFAGKDWYREGAAELIRRLCAWNPEAKTMTIHRTLGGNPRAGELRTVDLCFALMFLSRGRVPVAINKLSDPASTWNNRPRDVANLTRRIAENAEAGLNWQIVSTQAEPEQWLDAPLLYLASHEYPAWIPRDPAVIRRATEEQQQFRARRAAGEANGQTPPALPTTELDKLRRYLDLGGTLFAVSEGRNTALADAVLAAGRMMYPHLEWRDLPRDHPAYTIYQPVRGAIPVLRGLSNGVRELIILSPVTDFSEMFQVSPGKEDPLFNIGMNIFLYASEMNRARPRLDQHVLQRDAARVGSVPATIVHATHAGAWDAEPLALDVFAAWAWNERGLDVTVLNRPLATIHTISPRPSLVIVSGLTGLELSEAERHAVRAFAEAGGMILFENTGGRGDFTLKAEDALRGLFANPIRALLRHPVITGEGTPGATSVGRITYRPFSFEVFGSRETATRIRGILGADDRPLALFSREDLLNGVLDQPTWGVNGYASNWSREILANIVQYAATRR